MIKVANQILSSSDVGFIANSLRQSLQNPRMVDAALSTLRIWCNLPPPNRAKTSEPAPLFDCYYREFSNTDDLVLALVGHLRAQDGREAEEKLAFRVLGNLPCYESGALDWACLGLLGLVAKQGLLDNLRRRIQKEGYYGNAALLPAGENPDQLLQVINRRPPLERLYWKIATIHHIGRYYDRALKIGRTPGRRVDEMRSGSKFGLNETHPQVMADREAGVSIWSGTSSSAMDLMYLIKTGLEAKPDPLEVVAWAAFAFFHFMPTVASPSHTFHEVMRGAKRILGTMKTYSGYSSKVPSKDLAVEWGLSGAV